MTGLLVTGDLERDNWSVFDIASGSQRKIPREEMISQFQSACKRLRRDCAPDRVGNGFVLSNIATLLPKRSMTGDRDIPLEKAKSIAAQTVTLVDSVKDIASGRGWERNKYADMLRGIQADLEESTLLPALMDFAQAPTANKILGTQIMQVNKKQSAAVDLLAKIWRSVGSAVKGEERADIESSLKQLTV